MDEELKQKIVNALKQACRPDENADVNIAETGIDHVGGSVISTRFVGMTPSARQDLIWLHLDRALSPYERTRITFILTETREEYDIIRSQGSTEGSPRDSDPHPAQH